MKRILTLTVLLATTALPIAAQRTRCGTPEPGEQGGQPRIDPALSDCGYLTNSPQPQYAPTFFYDIPVVFHVIQSGTGAGFLSASKIQDQIDVLNEDFQAIPGSPGAPGTNARIRFHLAKTDPSGNPTGGITYTTNDQWYQDRGNYWTPLAWDPDRYLNIYTNAPPCCYGYVSQWPSQGAGQIDDRIVLWWEAVGRDPTVGWPLNMGRTATHEAGHYLGLYHTFCGGCGIASDCYGTGDLICDTNGQQFETSGCPSSKSSCGNPDPIHNYMDYSDDPCLWEFTPEQVNRMRCTLEGWRPNLYVQYTTEELMRAGTPANPSVLLPGATSGPAAGQTWDPRVDHTTFEPTADYDYLGVSLNATEVALGMRGTLLCTLPFELLFTNGSPGTPFSIDIPSDASLLGATFCAQAASLTIPGRVRLTNALDCTIGN